ncbi:MAG: hypothetical protein ACUVWX_07250 [Kiritimatiellia bacterium]
MTGKERIRSLFEGTTSDKPPVMHISFSSRVASFILGREAYVGGGMQQWREAAALWAGPDAHAEFLERLRRDALEIALVCGHDMVRPSYWREKRKPAARLDEYTFRFEAADGSWEVKRLDPVTDLFNTIDSYPKRKITLEILEAEVERAEAAPESYRPSEADFADLQYMIERAGGTMAIRAPGPWLCIPCQESVWLEASLLAPELVARYLDAQVFSPSRTSKYSQEWGFSTYSAAGISYRTRDRCIRPRYFTT